MGKKRIRNPESTYKFEKKNNVMQICSVISEWRVPGKQGCRALWLDVSERSGGESSSFVAGLPA